MWIATEFQMGIVRRLNQLSIHSRANVELNAFKWPLWLNVRPDDMFQHIPYSPDDYWFRTFKGKDCTCYNCERQIFVMKEWDFEDFRRNWPLRAHLNYVRRFVKI